MSTTLLRFLCSLGGGLAVLILHSWIRHRKRKAIENNGGDDFFNIRYRKEEIVTHYGSCHCGRVEFSIRAPKVIRAIDISTQIRFPRLSLPFEYFETNAETNVDQFVSLYAVKQCCQMGLYSFCNVCGVYFAFTPITNPLEYIQINVDCIHPSTITKKSVSYQSTTPEVTASPEDILNNYDLTAYMLKLTAQLKDKNSTTISTEAENLKNNPTSKFITSSRYTGMNSNVIDMTPTASPAPPPTSTSATVNTIYNIFDSWADENE